VRERWLRILFRRRMLVILLLLMQIAMLTAFIISRSRTSQLIHAILTVLSVLAVLYVMAHEERGSYRTLWVFLILSFPLFGGLMYLSRLQFPTRKMEELLQRAERKAAPLYDLPGNGYGEAKNRTGDAFPQVRYLQNSAGFPVYDQTETKYFPLGERMYESLLEELEKAEHYIFLEFFIVREGLMWNSILEILKRKAAQGVKVRLIYDDLGCFFLLPHGYAGQLERDGIECSVFNPFRPFLTTIQNNRDHRKIVVIDGRTAFTGGVNLSDEYINAVDRFGHWKDSGIMLRGKAAWSFTLLFLQMWELCRRCDEDYSAYYPWKDSPCPVPSDGLVQPYADRPVDRENVCENVYMQIICQARDYVYINTPYLILDDNMLSALCLAAKRGVDVRIVTPQRWDKRLVHMTTRSFYRTLLRAGVRVYEYSPGFLHAKSFVSDDHIAVVGTANLDFRSLYLHFECGVWLWDTAAIPQARQDFLETLEKCRPVTEELCDHGLLTRCFQDILRLFAPLM